MDYLSITEAAGKWGISRKRVQVLCITGRIPGAQRVGKFWAIPADAHKPADRRKNPESGGEKPLPPPAEDDASR